ncbi:hypothetical protein Tco_1511549 [Tanacetum coccineum]
MSVMANTSIVTTVMKTTTKEKAPKETDAVPKASILDFCEAHYEDILLVIRLHFGESPRKSQRMREDSQKSSVGTLPAGYHNPSERPKIRDRLRSNDGNAFDRLGHRRQSALERLSDTYSPSTTKSGPSRASSRDFSYSRGRSLNRDHP